MAQINLFPSYQFDKNDDEYSEDLYTEIFEGSSIYVVDVSPRRGYCNWLIYDFLNKKNLLPKNNFKSIVTNTVVGYGNSNTPILITSTENGYLTEDILQVINILLQGKVTKRSSFSKALLANISRDFPTDRGSVLLGIDRTHEWDLEEYLDFFFCEYPGVINVIFNTLETT